MRRLVIMLALAAIVAVPFLLRTKEVPRGRPDETLVIVTPHNEAIRHEFALGFEAWYRARTGRTVAVDWRVLGGTSEILRYLEGEYVTAFANYWTRRLGKPWSMAVQAGFANGELARDAPTPEGEARRAFLESDVGCGIDVFFGGGSFDFEREARAGRIVATDLFMSHPDWFSAAVIPSEWSGQRFFDPNGRWIGSVVSCYGIVFNRDVLRRLGIDREPSQWADLADPRYFGAVALCDPTKSSSIATAFEDVIQEQMHARLKTLETNGLAAAAGGDRERLESQAVREGWIAGMRLIQLIGANARYFTDTSQKPPIDVADGNCAAGLCIDFYGRQQEEALRRRGDSERLGFSSPPGGTGYSVDPIAILRGAPHRGPAEAFLEYVLSMEGQKLWNFRPGTPGGPREFALRRLPVRRDFYERKDWLPLRSDPNSNPYGPGEGLVYRPDWTGRLFREMAFIIRVMCQDTHADLAGAWRLAAQAPVPARARALAAMQDLSFVDYDRAGGEIARALESKNKVDEIVLAHSLAARFRAQYARAAALALGP